MIDAIVSLLLILGAGFVLIAGVGVHRLPDTLSRMHAATKAGAFGVALLLLAVVIAHPEPAVILKAVAVLVLFYLTAPLAGHVLGREVLRREQQRKLNLAEADGRKAASSTTSIPKETSP